MEVYVLVQVRRSLGATLLGVVCLALAIVLLLLGCSSIIMVYLAVLLIAAYYFLAFRYRVEYEYSYFDREVRFAKIWNKSRRKSLGFYSMEDVAVIAPAGDPSVARYENDSRVKVRDYTSRTKGTPYYEMVIQQEGETLLFKLELDEPYLEAVEKQYRQKVIR
jgi:type IV secretory pathway VirB3-like protein